MSGIVTMMTAFLKAAGFDPAQFREGAEGFIKHVYALLDEFDARMSAQEQAMARQESILRQILDAQTQLLRSRDDKPGSFLPIDGRIIPIDNARTGVFLAERPEPDNRDTPDSAAGTGNDRSVA